MFKLLNEQVPTGTAQCEDKYSLPSINGIKGFASN